jgi:hypothetical protein
MIDENKSALITAILNLATILIYFYKNKKDGNNK